MKYFTEIKIKNINNYEEMFEYGEDEIIAHNLPKMGTVATWTAIFENGYEVDIKLNVSEDDIWSEGVLFDKNGSTLAISEPSYELGGKWSFDFEGDIFEIEVIGS